MSNKYNTISVITLSCRLYLPRGPDANSAPVSSNANKVQAARAEKIVITKAAITYNSAVVQAYPKIYIFT